MLFDIIAWSIDHLQWILGGIFTTIFGIGRFIVTPQRLLIMAGSSVSNILMKLSTVKAVKQITENNAMADDVKKDGSIDAYFYNSVTRRNRLNTHLKSIRAMKIHREGPYALQSLIESLYDTGFAVWKQELREHIRELDRREEEVRYIVYQYEQAIDRIWEEFAGDLATKEKELIQLHIRWKHSTSQMRYETTTLRKFWKMIKLVRGQRKKWKVLNKAYDKQVKIFNKRVNGVKRTFNLRMQPHYLWLQKFEKNELLDRVNVFMADWSSMEQTVEFSRTMERLVEKTEKTLEIRQMMQLEMLPYDKEQLKDYILDELRGRVGMSPHADSEDMFEIWLRVHYLDCGRDGCPTFGRLGSQGFYDWVRRLAPPAAMGLAGGEFHHMPHKNGTHFEWINPIGEPPEQAAE